MKKCFVVAAILVLLSCEYKQVTPGDSFSSADSFTFGFAGGWCTGARFWLLRDQKLLVDSIKGCYRGETLAFQSTPLPSGSYALAKKILDDLPPYLFKNPTKTFGCPNCADQGTLYLGMTYKGSTYSWTLDPDTANLPTEIKGYVKEINELLSQL